MFSVQDSELWLFKRNALMGLSAGVGGRNTSWDLLARCRHKPVRQQALRGLLAPSLGGCQMASKWFLPAFLDPVFLTFPHQDVTRAAPLRRRERPGCVGGGRARKQQAGAVWQRQEFAWRCRAWLGRKEGGGGREKPSQLFAPEWLFLVLLSDCYRCAHSWVSPWRSSRASRWEGLADDFFLVSVSVGGSSQGGAFKVRGRLGSDLLPRRVTLCSAGNVRRVSNCDLLMCLASALGWLSHCHLRLGYS